MSKNLNRRINERLLSLSDREYQIRMRVLKGIASRMEKSETEFLKAFGGGMQIGFGIAEKRAALQRELYIKYLDRFSPQYHAVKDLLRIASENGWMLDQDTLLEATLKR